MASEESASCTVFEVEPGKYKVYANADLELGGWWKDHPLHQPRGELADQADMYQGKPKIVVQGVPSVAEEKLRETIEARVKALEADVASHNGWAQPKLETLAEILKQVSGVSRVSVERPSERR